MSKEIAKDDFFEEIDKEKLERTFKNAEEQHKRTSKIFAECIEKYEQWKKENLFN